MDILVTGGAGFIGSHLCGALVAAGHRVVTVDNFDPFYDPALKRQNILGLAENAGFRLFEADIRDVGRMESVLRAARVGAPDVVVHLAARAGVRPSIEDPLLYSAVNVDGTAAVLELTRRMGATRFVFASSSSVYGNSPRVPLAETDPADEPISPYAATKRSGELLCHTYHHLHGLSVVCLRLFTVYGPRQRPDMAIHRFARLMASDAPIPMYGAGDTERDYTYVEDVVQGFEGAIGYTGAHPGTFEIVNLGGGRQVRLRRLIELLAEALGTSPQIEQHPLPPGDVQRTCAEIRKAHRLFGYTPRVPIEVGIGRFAEWFREVGGGAPRPGAPARRAARCDLGG